MPRTLAELSLKEIQEKYADPAALVSGQALRKLQRDPRAGAQKLYKTLAKRYEEQKKERLRLDAMLHFERLLWKQGVVHIAGVDEVGMGPLAGPVVAAAVVFPPETEIAGIDDSKALDEETRLRLDREIRSRAAAVGIGVVEVDEIDRLNIYHAGLHPSSGCKSIEIAPPAHRSPRLTPFASYGEDERERFYRTFAEIGILLAQMGTPVLLDATANKRAYRAHARSRIERFAEVFVDTPLEVCAARDPKGLYRAAREGRSSSLPGPQAAYEPPLRPELVVSGAKTGADEAAQAIIALLEARGWI